MSITILHPGFLSLLQDAGRFGQHQIGLTNGGPLDPLAYQWANRLCENTPADSPYSNATTIEVSLGGCKLKALCTTRLAITGAELPAFINDQPVPLWRTHRLHAGDVLELGYQSHPDAAGCRSYIAVSGGFQVTPAFGSTATVVREGIGGLNGRALQAGDCLPCATDDHRRLWTVPAAERPQYLPEVDLRVVLGYQQHSFSAAQQQRFFQHTYTVSDRCDRMGYRLIGPQITSTVDGILSEGICLGAIQIPADGQPIVLMNDRQTIGGYPKIGSVLSLDLAKLAQLLPGGRVNFTPITIHCAHNALHLAHSRFCRAQLQPLPSRLNV